MKIRYQADADLNQNIVTGVLRREPTIDFQTAFAAKLKGVNLKLQRQSPILYLLEVAPLLSTGNILQGLYSHQLCLVHARQIQVTLVDLP